MNESLVGAKGLSVFGPLRAEEEPWLEECFVPPPDFDVMAEMNSIIVFSPAGGGKSAVRRMLAARIYKPDRSPSLLIVEWEPSPSVWEPAVGFESVPGQVAHIFDLCAMETLRYLASYPAAWATAPQWVQQMLTWFVWRFLRGKATIRASDLLESEPGSSFVAQILQADVEDDLLPSNDWRLVTVEFSKAIQRLGLKGIWVMVDRAEQQMMRESERLLPALISFLSTISLFEQGAFAYKVFLPVRFYMPLLTASGLDRRRFAAFHLTWSEEQLQRIAERRLSIALGKPDFSLKSLCTAPRFLEWMRRIGGNSPRVWLEGLRPLVAHYLETGQPVKPSDWKRLRRQFLPPLILDEGNRVVIVGGRVIPADEIPAGAYRLLCYLYRNPGRVVHWEELYYKGYHGKERVPLSGEKGHEAPADYKGVLYSRLSDLRKMIEPDPSDPIYIETIRDEGIRLRLAW